ncbi:hypothetical protein C922_04652 [Plasmodium inui San Antonio 1]|uniref:Uncharacterized protein n=1 Tax=Plasmodium inui San Antonio 1 TaxID=1237626 RepID=W7A039_9APIC|nr:hypothetical protein C922_04652 [Plasmodium inui San Antonio 1]EUD64920.1 hypothetical protein C922_04652 [Plasmodium inui San Antonio 1]
MNFPGWIKDRIWDRQRQRSETHGPLTGLSLSTIEPKDTTGAKEIKTTRWDNLTQGDLITLTDLSLRSRLTCQAMEVWMRHLEQSGRQKWDADQSTCKKGDVGFLFSGITKKECLKEKGQMQWSHLTSDKPLMSNHAYDRELAVCMDLISIILIMYQNIRKGASTWEINSRDACEIIYEELEGWSDKDTAEHIMQEWFNNRPSQDMDGWGIPIKGKTDNRSELWMEFFEQAKSFVIGMQCMKEDRPDAKWSTSCVRRRNENNCEQINDEEGTQEQRKVRSRRGVDRYKNRKLHLFMCTHPEGEAPSDIRRTKLKGE